MAMLIDGGSRIYRPPVAVQTPPASQPSSPPPVRTRVNASPGSSTQAQEQTQRKQVEAAATAQWADQQIQQLTQLRRQTPALAVQLNDQISRVERERQASQEELTSAMAAEYRQQAQNTPLNTSADLYGDLEQAINARTVDPAFAQTSQQIAQQAKAQALAAEPGNLNEAQWQRNAQVWEAMQADWDLASQERGIGAPGFPQASWVQPTLEAARQEADQAWAGVSAAFAREYAMVARDETPSPYSYMAVDNYRQNLALADYDPVYHAKIMLAAQASPATPTATAQDISAVTNPYATRVQDAYQAGGAAAALTEIEAVQQALANDAFITGSDIDPATSQTRLMAAQEDLDKKLRPTYEALAANAPQDLAGIAGQPADNLQEEYLRAEAVSGRLTRYAQLLPQDLVAQVVDQSKNAWEPAVQFLGERSAAQDVFYSEMPVTHTYGSPQDQLTYQSAAEASSNRAPAVLFDGITANFAQVGDVLANTPGGDQALVEMAEIFAGHFSADNLIGLGTLSTALGEQAISNRHGAFLAVEVANQLVADGKTVEADILLESYRRGTAQLTEQSQATLDEFVANRDELNHYMLNFPGAVQDPAQGSAPGEIDVRSLELQDAMNGYLNDHPEVVEQDAELLTQIDRDAYDLWSAIGAIGSLSNEARALEHGQRIEEPLNGFLDEQQNPGVAQIYAATPSVQAQWAQGTALALQNADGAQTTATVPEQQHGMLEQLADQQSFWAIPRALRGVIDASGLGGNTVNESTTGSTGFRAVAFRGTGIGLYGYSALASWADAAGVGRDNLNNLDVWAAQLNATAYTGQTARVSAQLLTASFSGNQSLRAVLDVGKNLGPGSSMFPTYRAGQTLIVAPLRGVFVAADAFTLASDITQGRSGPYGSRYLADGMILAGDAGMLVAGLGSAGYFGAGTAAAAAAGTGWVPVVGWIGAGATLLGVAGKYAIDRVEQANRYETTDQRRFLAHFGSRDDAGVLRPFTQTTEVSSADSHNVEVRTIAQGGPRPGEIVYTGLSADAVDELMNHDSSGDHSAIPVLDAYAAANGIDPRNLYLDWYNNLTHDQRKELPVAGFGVEPDAQGNYARGFTDESMIGGWSEAWRSFEQFAEDSGVSIEQRNAIIGYTNEYGLYQQDDPNTLEMEGDGYTTYDPDAIRVLLGLQDPPAGQPAPSQEVVQSARAVMANEIYGSLEHGFRPRTLDEFGLWMDIHGYPGLPAASTVGSLPEKPVPSEPAIPSAQPQPPTSGQAALDNTYTVRPGDSLWSIAKRSTQGLDVLQLIAHHNAQNPAGEADFDPQRADNHFFTPQAPGDTRRDPDLIHPGEEIYLPQEALADR
jgi:hypothetical protein